MWIVMSDFSHANPSTDIRSTRNIEDIDMPLPSTPYAISSLQACPLVHHRYHHLDARTIHSPPNIPVQPNR